MPLSREDARDLYQHLRQQVIEALRRPDWDADIVSAIAEDEEQLDTTVDPAELLVRYLVELEDRVFAQTRRAYEMTLAQMSGVIRTEDRAPVRDIVLSLGETDEALFGIRDSVSLGQIADGDELFQTLVSVRTEIQHDLGIEFRRQEEHDEDEDEGEDIPPEPEDIG